MPSITIAPYSIRFRQAHARKFMKLDDPALYNIRTFFSDYFKNLQSVNIDDKLEKKVLSAKTVSQGTLKTNALDSDTNQGLIITGEYGYETDLYDTKAKKNKYRRSTSEAEMMPFYFTTCLPHEGDAGILLLQRFGTRGVRSVLSADILSKFNQAYPNITLCLFPQIPEGALERLMKGGLHAITLRKDKLPRDVCDAVKEQNVHSGRVDLVITAKNGNTFSSAYQAIKGRLTNGLYTTLIDVIEVDGFKHDRILLDIKIGDKMQRIDLSNLAKLRARIDITKKITLGKDGHPDFASIAKESHSILVGLRNLMRV